MEGIKYRWGKDSPNNLNVFVHIDGSECVVYTADEYILDGSTDGIFGITLPGLYSWLRERSDKQPIALHLADLADCCFVDDLANEIRFGRLSVVHMPELPPIPPDPYADDRELAAALDGE